MTSHKGDYGNAISVVRRQRTDVGELFHVPCDSSNNLVIVATYAELSLVYGGGR